MNKIFKVVAWSQPQEIQTQNGSMKKKCSTLLSTTRRLQRRSVDR